MGDLNWNELLPGRTWRRCDGVNWAQQMPPPLVQQNQHIPENFDGSCGVHTFAEALTSSLRNCLPSENIAVDLPELLRMCVHQEVLRSTGTSFKRLKAFLDTNGVPLVGGLPDHFVLQGRECDQVDDHLLSISALGTGLFDFEGYSLPSTPTSDEAEAAMGFRELLCEALEICPVVICLPLQKHYRARREEGEPYRKFDGDHNYMAKDIIPRWLSYVRSFFGVTNTRRMWHCVTAFAYDCPGGDVRTMRVQYQENSSGAPDAQPGRHFIDPNAIEFCFLPIVDYVYFRNTHADH